MTSTSNPAPEMSIVYGIPQEQNDVCSSYLARIKRTAIVQLIGGCVLVALGIVAIILMATWSYFATAIWSGILIFGATGVIGILAGNNGNKCLIRTYMCMSIFGCLMGIAIFHMHIFAAILEAEWRYDWDGNWYNEPGCHPGDYYSWIPNCAKSEAARKTFDALITITGFFLFVMCIVSASYGCCASCRGCESCCKKICCCDGSGCKKCGTPTPQPVTAIFKPQGPTVATQGHQQAGMYIVQQGPAPVMQNQQVAIPMPATTNQAQAPYYIVSSATHAPPPPQPIPGHMHAQQPNPVAPPTYYAASQSVPHVELPESKE